MEKLKHELIMKRMECSRTVYDQYLYHKIVYAVNSAGMLTRKTQGLCVGAHCNI
jgi:hypothetical protein